MKKEQEFLRRAVIEQQKYAQIAEEMNLPQSELTRMWEALKEERESLAETLSLYKRKMKADNPDAKFDSSEFERFRDWYETAEKKCFYCEITQDEIKELFDRDLVKTKRKETRGRKLEVERRKPNEPYSNTQNLVWCCYWCNNAKTDEFSEEEFKPIGILIGKALMNRLK